MGSMNLTDIKELYRNTADYIDKEVIVGGWVRSIRDSKTFGFIVHFALALFLASDNGIKSRPFKLSITRIQYIVKYKLFHVEQWIQYIIY